MKCEHFHFCNIDIFIESIYENIYRQTQARRNRYSRNKNIHAIETTVNGQTPHFQK